MNIWPKFNSVVCVVPLAVGDCWCRGLIHDQVMMCEHDPAGLSPVVLVVLRADGYAAGMRRLFLHLLLTSEMQDLRVAGFAMRTRLVSVESVFKRFAGVMTYDEQDGDRRWWAPAEPGLTWLRSTFRPRPDPEEHQHNEQDGR